MTKKVYIACSMIKAKQLDFSLLDTLISYVEKQNFTPFVPGKMKDAPSEEIFRRDMNWLKQSSRIIADVNEPSHGVGMEIMYAHIHDIPVLGLIHENNKPLSRMVEGSPHTLIISYNSKANLLDSLTKIHLESLHISLCNFCSKKTIHLNSICQKC